ncbi:hypothetical protein EI94DRAFT_1733105 [Lactarius quietus]|nr:hypothetical protein EI94DRAFT_1733105 [Lactarius quietus]
MPEEQQRDYPQERTAGPHVPRTPPVPRAQRQFMYFHRACSSIGVHLASGASVGSTEVHVHWKS